MGCKEVERWSMGRTFSNITEVMYINMKAQLSRTIYLFRFEAYAELFEFLDSI